MQEEWEEAKLWTVGVTSTPAGERPMLVELALGRDEVSLSVTLREDEVRELSGALERLLSVDAMAHGPRR